MPLGISISSPQHSFYTAVIHLVIPKYTASITRQTLGVLNKKGRVAVFGSEKASNTTWPIGPRDVNRMWPGGFQRRTLQLECSQAPDWRTDRWTHGRTDGHQTHYNVSLNLRLVGDKNIYVLYAQNSFLYFVWLLLVRIKQVNVDAPRAHLSWNILSPTI